MPDGEEEDMARFCSQTVLMAVNTVLLIAILLVACVAVAQIMALGSSIKEGSDRRDHQTSCQLSNMCGQVMGTLGEAMGHDFSSSCSYTAIKEDCHLTTSILSVSPGSSERSPSSWSSSPFSPPSPSSSSS